MQTIYLDISNKGVIPTINAKQGDVGRKFLAVITDNGTTLSGLKDPVFSVWYEGDSGSGNYSSVDDRPAVVFDGKNATVELATQMLTNAGDGEITLVMNDTNGYQIGVWNIDYCVESVMGMDSQEVENYYTALSETASMAIDAASRAEAAASKVQLDDTLTKKGYSADAKAAGDAVLKVQNEKLPRVLTAGIDYGEQYPENAEEGKIFFVEDPQVDFVVEVSSDGEWKWRKWDSGFVECWGRANTQSGVWASVRESGLYYTQEYVILNFPQGLFAEINTTNVNVSTAEGAVVSPTTVSFNEQRVSARFLRVLGGTDDILLGLSVYAAGRWK